MIYRDVFRKRSDGGTLIVRVEDSEPESVWISHERDGKRIADIRLSIGESYELSNRLEEAAWAADVEIMEREDAKL